MERGVDVVIVTKAKQVDFYFDNKTRVHELKQKIMSLSWIYPHEQKLGVVSDNRPPFIISPYFSNITIEEAGIRRGDRIYVVRR
ncbi:hypothetical protein [Acanthamoeba polyphaga mimivirus]|uniref:Ubiquitin-like domain-containing protein n=2 Tax=Megamimivirinae TaxID=3044648 RepID=A0A2L2DK54_MIMIV|nr:hypothetical protein MegaChil _gp0803 [Megavirus chiliensis]AEQ32482.1 ubiquitin-like protein [Megavirus chiliensis]AVG46526.1 hypothetical protein [Acanthamoeba polyphaga mimivirus]AVG47638.1 hypothetical protein [Acanthamoeba polyphaga mimivirus]